MKASIPFAKIRDEMLQDDELAALYLKEALADRNIDRFKLALNNLARARAGGMKALSEKTNLNREQLYRTLSEKGNPRLDTLGKVLNALGLRLSVEPKKDQKSVALNL